MQEAALAKVVPKARHHDVAFASDDRWLVECLTLAAFAALAYSQILGENVLLALF